MPEADTDASVALRRVVLAVESGLRQSLDIVPERLGEADLSAGYPTRHFVRGWRIPIEFPDGETRRIDLLLGAGFPRSYPRTSLVDRPEHLTWPHIEHDGILCLLPVMAEIDASDPVAVSLNLVSRSVRLVTELLEGSIIERDFREEFLTYWFYGADGARAPSIVSLLRAEAPSRTVACWRGDRGLVIVGEDDAQLGRWLRNRYGEPGKNKTFHIERAAFIWREQPPVPSEYPRTGSDLLSSIASDGDVEALVAAASALPEELLVVMGATGRGGNGLFAVTTTSARKSRSRAGRIEKPLTRGFRDKTLTPQIAIARTYSSAPLLRSTVSRADALWVHGRGKDARSETLLGKICTVIGCGSVGSSVATRLAHAGVGQLNLVDFDKLAWSNIGRHELGAESIELNKAEELARRLRAGLPHLEIEGFPIGAHTLISSKSNVLERSDLIVVATGSWQADGELNEWHLAGGRRNPMIYGWTESHACAGQAVTIAALGGCLRCGIEATGVPKFELTEWPDGATLEEPSCGNHFQPYGAVELGAVVSLIAEASLDALLSPPDQSSHSLWLGSSDQLGSSGGSWTTGAQAVMGDHRGGLVTRRSWTASQACPLCSSALLA